MRLASAEGLISMSIIPQTHNDGTGASSPTILPEGTAPADLKADMLRALHFWFDDYPDDCEVTVAQLMPDRSFTPRRFPLSRLESIADAYAGEVNAYVRLAVTHKDEPIALHKTGTKQQIYGTKTLHLDLDPDGQPDFQHRAVEALNTFALRPSMITCSGRGVHATWRLDTFERDIKLVERINKLLMQSLSSHKSGNEWDATHFLRLPGTINPKDDRTRYAYIIQCDDQVMYSLEQFEALAPVTSNVFPQGGGGDAGALGEGPGPAFTDEEIENTILASSSRTKYLRLKSGDLHGYYKPDGTYDRSAADGAFVMILARYTFDHAQIDRLFRHSGLVRPDGWERDAYRKTTIESAIGKVNEARQAELEQLTELKLASIFAERHGENVRYDGDAREWLVWDGARFRPDSLGRHQELAKETVAYLKQEAAKLDGRDFDAAITQVRRAESKKSIDAMTALARSDERISTTSEDLDLDPLILNLLNCTLELRPDGLVVREHRRSDMLTKVAPVEYDPKATSPTYDQFVADATAGEDQDELTRYLAQVAGYAMLGITVEKVFFICVGPPDSGKTTYAEIVASVLGSSYAMKMSSEFFLSSMNDKFAYYAAQARGVRFLYSSETEENRSLAQSRIKEFTGGQDRIPARHPGGRPFHYAPTATAMLVTNHLPKIRGSDAAIWERVRVIPFDNTRPKDRQDKFLVDKLRSEASGILNRFIEGWDDWRQNGLIVPRSVARANEGYRKANALVLQWMEDEIIEGDEYSAPSAWLYDSFKTWCNRHDEKALSQKAWGAELTKLGFERFTDSTGYKRYRGLTNRGVASPR